jgi:hypothetical protein
MTTHRFTTLLAATWIIATACGLDAQVADDKTVATVNGTAIKVIQLFLIDAHLDLETAPAEKKSAIIEQAIDRELLYQEAKRLKLDQDPQIREALAYRTTLAAERQIEYLATAFRQHYRQEHFSATEHGDADDGHTHDHQAHTKQGQAVHNEWVSSVFDTTPVTLNGEVIPAAVISSQSKQNDLAWLVVRAMLEIEISEDPDVAPDMAAITSQLAGHTLVVGETTYDFDSLSWTRMITNDQSGGRLRSGVGLSYMLGSLVFAEAARSEGFDKNPDRFDSLDRAFRSQKMGTVARAQSASDPVRLGLIDAILDRKDMLNPSKIEISEAEIDKAVAGNVGYQNLLQQPNGAAILRQVLAGREKSTRMGVAKASYLKELRSKAKIEIADQ